MNDNKKLPVDILLAQSFKKLACQQPVEKITIKQITDAGGGHPPDVLSPFQ